MIPRTYRDLYGSGTIPAGGTTTRIELGPNGTVPDGARWDLLRVCVFELGAPQTPTATIIAYVTKGAIGATFDPNSVVGIFEAGVPDAKMYAGRIFAEQGERFVVWIYNGLADHTYAATAGIREDPS